MRRDVTSYRIEDAEEGLLVTSELKMQLRAPAETRAKGVRMAQSIRHCRVSKGPVGR